MLRLRSLLLMLILSALSCSTQNPSAPGTDQSHSAGYVVTHGVEANADLTGCKVCHGTNFTGTGNPVPGCFSCHETGPPFGIHPLPYIDPQDHGPAAKANQRFCRNCHGKSLNDFDGGIVADPNLFNTPAGTCSASSCHPAAKAHPTNWQGANEDTDPAYDSSHRTINENAVNTSCTLCHKTDAPGEGPMPEAPSCFSASFTNSDGITSGCHTGGFNVPSHDIPFVDAVLHSPPAKANLADCQDCHGNPGTIQFDGGIAATACSSAQCHPAAGAHPTNWQGTNDVTPGYSSSHRTAGSTDTACAICHNVAADAPGPDPGAPSCFSASFTNADGSATGCHATGPGAPHAIPFTAEVLHGPEAKTNLANCQDCHGNPGTTQFDGGIAATACSSTQCHPAAGAHPTNWQGTNDATPGYSSSHRNAGNQNVTCSLCHDFTQGRTPPDLAAPSCFSVSFTNADGSVSGCHSSGPGAPHALPFIDANLHGPEAKADLTYCQTCHADPFDGGAGTNPRFNVKLGNLVNGCEDCHPVNSAHPFPSWTGPPDNSHKTAGNQPVACALCHGANLLGPAEGGVGRACSDCHLAGDPLVDINCTSCHNDPPDSAFPAGNTRPNRAGSHGMHNALPRVADICITCHNGSGTDTSVHYDESTPANVDILAIYNAKTGAFTYSPAGDSCSGVSCHGGQQTPNWLTGTIDVDTDCLSCHERGTAQFNSYNSGRHKRHLEDLDRDERLTCTDCHDTTKLAAGHFVRLDTSQFEANADQTLLDSLGYNTSTNQGCNVAGCHGQKRWF